MTQKLTILAQKGRNKHGQRLVLVQCSCGSPAFECREDSFKQNLSTSCGFCRGGRKRKVAQRCTSVGSLISALLTDQIPASVSDAEVVSSFKRGTTAWYDDQIASKEAAALVLEKDIKNLQTQITDPDALKRWTNECSAFDKLNHQISRLQTQKAKAETAVKKSEKSIEQTNRERIEALGGK